MILRLQFSDWMQKLMHSDSTGIHEVFDWHDGQAILHQPKGVNKLLKSHHFLSGVPFI